MPNVFRKLPGQLDLGSLDHPKESLSCSLCVEINGIHAPLHTLFFPSAVETRILHETRNWVVIPSLGPLTQGHIMLVPRKHFFSVLNCPDEILSECKMLLSRCASKLEWIYQQPVLVFEHGSTSRQLDLCGACIDHAHIHLVPGPLSFVSAVISEFDEWQFRGDLINLIEVAKENPYLLVGRQGNQSSFWVHICSDDIPSQFLRKILAEQLGRGEEWNWRRYINHEIFVQTINDWRGA